MASTNSKSDMKLSVTVDKQQLLNECNHHLSLIPTSKLTFDVKGATAKLSNLNINSISFTNSVLAISLTAKVGVEKRTMLADVAGDGIVELSCSTAYSISKDWHLSTKFNYDSHQWVQSPDVSFGVIQLPVKSLVDATIENQKESIVKTINEQMNAISDLQKYIRPLLVHFNQKQKLAKATIQFAANVSSLIINTIEDNSDSILIEAELKGKPMISLSDANPKDQQLPEIHLNKETEV